MCSTLQPGVRSAGGVSLLPGIGYSIRYPAGDVSDINTAQQLSAVTKYPQPGRRPHSLQYLFVTTRIGGQQWWDQTGGGELQLPGGGGTRDLRPEWGAGSIRERRPGPGQYSPDPSQANTDSQAVARRGYINMISSGKHSFNFTRIYEIFVLERLFLLADWETC